MLEIFRIAFKRAVALLRYQKGILAGIPKALNPVPRELTRYKSILRMSIRQWVLYHQRNISVTRRKGGSKMKWMGVETLKMPTDMWIYQEVLHEVRPDYLVEIGSYIGGSTLYFAHIMELMDHGKVISIDIDRSFYVPKHERIVEITGDASSEEVLREVKQITKGAKIMVIHDGDHRKESVLRDIRNYAGLVSPGSYLVVEDGMIELIGPGEGMGIDSGFGEGPLSAILEFLKEHKEFIVDESRERYLITSHPYGFLKRIG